MIQSSTGNLGMFTVTFTKIQQGSVNLENKKISYGACINGIQKLMRNYININKSNDDDAKSNLTTFTKNVNDTIRYIQEHINKKSNFEINNTILQNLGIKDGTIQNLITKFLTENRDALRNLACHRHKVLRYFTNSNTDNIDRLIGFVGSFRYPKKKDKLELTELISTHKAHSSYGHAYVKVVIGNNDKFCYSGGLINGKAIVEVQIEGNTYIHEGEFKNGKLINGIHSAKIDGNVTKEYKIRNGKVDNDNFNNSQIEPKIGIESLGNYFHVKSTKENSETVVSDLEPTKENPDENNYKGLSNYLVYY